MKYLGYLILLFSLHILYHLLNLATIGKKGHRLMLPVSGVVSRRSLKQECQSWCRTYSPCSGSWAKIPTRCLQFLHSEACGLSRGYLSSHAH